MRHDKIRLRFVFVEKEGRRNYPCVGHNYNTLKPIHESETAKFSFNQGYKKSSPIGTPHDRPFISGKMEIPQ